MSPELHRKFFKKFLKSGPPQKGTFLRITKKDKKIVFCLYDEKTYINGEMIKRDDSRPGFIFSGCCTEFFESIDSVKTVNVNEVMDTLNFISGMFHAKPAIFD